MLQEKNAPEKNFSPREEERLRELSIMCIEQVLENPSPVTKLSILSLVEEIKYVITYNSEKNNFLLLFDKFLKRVSNNLGTRESREFNYYCYFSPITWFVFESQIVADVEKRFNALKKQICQELREFFTKKKYNNLLQFYRLTLLYSTVAEQEDFENLKKIPTIKADLALVQDIKSNRDLYQIGIENILVAFNSWNESTRLP